MKERPKSGNQEPGIEEAGELQPAETNVLRMLTLDFAAILVGYNIPRDEARRVAAQAIEPVRKHCLASGSVLRRVRFSKLD